MNKIITIILLFLVAVPLQAQHRYQEVLDAMETGNPTLKALRSQSEADRAAVGVGEVLADPEVEVGYFKGSPSEMGNRLNLSMTQSFEFPTIYVHKHRLFEIQRQASTLQYEVARAKMFYEAQLICADWVYYEAVHQIQSAQVNNALAVAELYKKRYDAGDCSLLDYNRAQLYLADMQAKSAAVGLQADHALREIWLLTGVDGFLLSSAAYQDAQLADSFDGWYETKEHANSELRYLSNYVDEKQREVSLSTSEWLPKMHAGYASENVAGESFRGAVVGMSLPLWNNHNRVRQSRMAADAAADALNAQKIETYKRMMCTFHRAKAVEKNLQRLEKAYSDFNSVELLLKALNAGEIGLEQYLQGVASYAEMELLIWETRHELEYLVLELNSITL